MRVRCLSAGSLRWHSIIATLVRAAVSRDSSRIHARRSRTSVPRWRRCAILSARAICRWPPSVSVLARVTWRRRLPKEPALRAFAGIAGYYKEATPESIAASQAGIERGRAAERKWRETEVAETIPAVAADGGDVAMPLREAYEFYGTPRGAVPNYVNGFAVQSFAYTTPFDAVGTARDINVPTLVVHSENALAPPLARQFIAGLRAPHRELWLRSLGQIDFYDDPQLIGRAADAVAEFFRETLQSRNRARSGVIES